jgi:signal transduction histidine kinase
VLHRTLDGLDPQTLTRHGIVPALRERATALGCTADFEVYDDVASNRFTPAAEAAVYYCCSEALQNAAKHSPNAPVVIALNLQRAPDRLCFAVTDQGPGFETDHISGGGGLENMADRIATAGGALEIRSSRGEGTRIAGWMPASPLDGGQRAGVTPVVKG